MMQNTPLGDEMYKEHVNPPQSAEGFPLSPQQSHLWQWHHAASSPLPRCLLLARIHGPLLPERLRLALGCLLLRHESLRTSFSSRALPLQFISPPASPQLLLLPPCAEPLPLLQARLLSRLRDPAPADVPALRVLLAPDSSHSWLLGISLPELCADGPSLLLLWQELLRFYQHGPQAADDLQEPIQYADFAQWQLDLLAASQPSEPARSFWHSLHHPGEQAAKVLSLPIPSHITVREREAIQFRLSAEQVKALTAATSYHNVSEASVLLTCWLVVLARRCGQDNLYIGLRHNGRSYPELYNACGRFARDLPLHIAVPPRQPCQAFLHEVDALYQQMHNWQHYFSWELFDELSENQTTSIQFAYEELPPAVQIDETQWHVELLEAAGEQGVLQLLCQRQGSDVKLTLHYCPEYLPDQTLHQLKESYELALTHMLAEPATPIGRLPVIGHDEYQQLVVLPNQTQQSHQPLQCLHELFTRQASQTPALPAIRCGEEMLSYEELERSARQLAQRLRRCGVKPEQRVALYLERSMEQIIALLGVLKAGGVYVPLEVQWPVERVKQLLRENNVHVILTQEHYSSNLEGMAPYVLCLDNTKSFSKQHSVEEPLAEVRPDQLAYVIYTSGSTGTPKGVAVEHRQLCNYTSSILELLRPTPGTSFALVSTLAADLGNTMIFPALCSGGCLHILTPEQAADPTALATYVQRYPIDCLKIVPSHLLALLTYPHAEQFLPRRYLLVGGEALSWQLVREVQQLAPACSIFNHYGPTETTVGASVYHIPQQPPSATFMTVPLGSPLANVEFYLLDDHLQPAPAGVAAELYIGGAGVARGYLNQPAATAERFIPHPFTREAGARLYKTGDMVRYLPGGEIAFLGRSDHQIKIRGFRVEIGEIEALLYKHPLVKHAIVLVRGAASSVEQSMIACVMLQPGQSVTRTEIKSFLEQRVPDYMVPTFFAFLESFPLTPQGKIDRHALTKLAETHLLPDVDYIPPRNAVEEAIADIWKEVLGAEQIGIHESFFDRGGHSLLATQVISRLRTCFRLELPVRSIFDAVTIEQLAQVLIRQEPQKGQVEKIAHLLQRIKAMPEADIKNALEARRKEKGL